VESVGVVWTQENLMENKPIQQIGSLFSHIHLENKRSRRTERGDLIERFMDRINSDRDGVKYKKLTIQRIAHLLSLYKTSDLYILEKKCLDSKNYSATWWWYVKNISK